MPYSSQASAPLTTSTGFDIQELQDVVAHLPAEPKPETPYFRRNTKIGDVEVFNNYEMARIICAFVNLLTKHAQDNHAQRRQTLQEHISLSTALKDQRFAKAAFALAGGVAQAGSKAFFEGQDLSTITNPWVWGACKVAEYAPGILNTAASPYFEAKIGQTETKQNLAMHEVSTLKTAEERTAQMMQQLFQRVQEMLQISSATKSTR